jgi:hypothetical protein
MVGSVFTPTRLFSVDQANATLPLVRAITRDLAHTSRDLLDRRERLRALLAGRSLTSGNPYDDELAAIERELERDAGLIQEFIDELAALGVESTSAVDGVVDFPAMLNGRPVSLCWKLGEECVAYWHEPHADFDDRQPIACDSAAAATAGTSEDTLGSAS